MAGLVISAQVMCSFLQVYQEKVYDLLNPRLMVDLPVREHPKKGTHAEPNFVNYPQIARCWGSIQK